jgi:hypothetical protein
MKLRSACLKIVGLGLITATLLSSTDIAKAGAIHDASLFTTNTLAANDDASVGPVSLGFTINFYGQNYSSLYVNNNGNVTFDAALSTFIPFSLLSTTHPILAPFFADVDTRGAGSGLVQYGSASLGGHSVFGVNWIDVGYFNRKVDKLNSFQLIIIDRSDISPGDFDFEFNYDRILWDTVGGHSARVGWSNGVSASFELVGSGINGALLDGGPNALVSHSLNSNIPGQYIFQVRNGQVQPPSNANVPEPVSSALLSIGLVGLAAIRRKSKPAA